MSTLPRDTLANRRVLIAEDEYFIARDIARALHALGAEVVGPVPSRDELQTILATGERLDAAILDINLNGEMIFPVLEALTFRGIPIVFATGYDQAAVPARYQDIPRWQKPFDPRALVQALPELVRDP
ncbi:response regulator [Microvirga yunnanensis]|uniref:response regulator n=1 Tax=Microvirga yunnanensis TaxID=2953740 RepID=UPI0021C9746B|nr:MULTISPECIES: response regulator [unclassified Microvirga]